MMPTSITEGKEFARYWFDYHKPRTVTDVGPGEGTYAKMLRPRHHGVWWTAIEIFKPYISKYKLVNTQRRKTGYDEVHHMDARLAPLHLFQRDLVIFGDVLEHMPKEDAVALLNKAVAAGAQYILVSIPTVYAPQGVCEGNEHETHVHHWTFDEMQNTMIGLPHNRSISSKKGDVVSVWWWNRGTE